MTLTQAAYGIGFTFPSAVLVYIVIYYFLKALFIPDFNYRKGWVAFLLTWVISFAFYIIFLPESNNFPYPIIYTGLAAVMSIFGVHIVAFNDQEGDGQVDDGNEEIPDLSNSGYRTSPKDHIFVEGSSPKKPISESDLNSNERSTMKHDEHLYLEASNEVDGGRQDIGLWIKAMTMENGDEKKAKYQYIKLRVEILREEEIALADRLANKEKYDRLDQARKIYEDIDNIFKDEIQTVEALKFFSHYAKKDKYGFWGIYQANDEVAHFNNEADFYSRARDLIKHGYRKLEEQ